MTGSKKDSRVRCKKDSRVCVCVCVCEREREREREREYLGLCDDGNETGGCDDATTPSSAPRFPGMLAEANEAKESNESNESRYSQNSKNIGFWT
jgi:hypothetical protein